MMKNTLRYLHELYWKPSFFKRWLFTFLATGIIASGYAANISSTVTGGNWNSAATWVGGVVPAQGDNVTIVAGSTVTVTAAAACTNLTLNGALTMNNTGITFKIGNPGSNQANLTLNSGGSFFIGSANTVEFVATQTGAGITNNGGTIISTGINGSDGGTIQTDANSGGGFAISGSSQTVVYNFLFIQNATFNTSAAPNMLINGTFTIPNNNWGWAGGSKPPIYGSGSTLSIDNNGQGYTPGGNRYEWQQFAPGAATIGVTPGYPNSVIIADVGSSKTNYNGNQYGVSLSGSWSINGDLQIGTPTASAFVDLDNGGAGTNNFSCGGITIEPNSKLAGPGTGSTFNVNGNWSSFSTSPGAYTPNSGTVTFGGIITDTINVAPGAENIFNNVVVNKGIKLNSPVSLGASGVLTLTSGIVQTDPTNVLTLNNPSTTAISGGGSASYINGPLAWLMAATSSTNYLFPVGSGNTYLPLTLSPNTNSSTTATVRAFNTGSGGTPDGVTVTSLSTTEYWSVSTTSPFTTGASISVTRPSAVGSFNALAKSSSATGVYNAIGGTVSGNSIINANAGTTPPWFISMVVAPLSVEEVSSVNATCAGTTGTITVQGSGGTQPYSYQIDGGAFSAPTSGSYTSGGLLPGPHSAYVKDNTGAIAGPVIVTLLGSLQINSNKDTSVCLNSSVSLTAVNLTASGATPTPTFSWSTSPTGTPVVGTNATLSIPAATATQEYYVTSQLYNNVLNNPGFESGNSGFTTDYAFSTTSPYGAAPNPHGGLFYVCSAANLMCTGFTPYTPHSGSLMLACDGPINGTGGNASVGGSRIWYQSNIPVSVGTTYTFSYWYGYADADFPNQVQAYINGVSLPGTNPVTMTAPWQHASYTWTANSATASIALYNVGPNDNSDLGNDFMLDDMAFYTPCTVTDSIKVSVGTAALAGTVTPASQTICSGGTPGSDLKLTGNSNSVVRWEYSTDKTFAIGVTKVTNITQTFTATAIAALSLAANTYYFHAVVNGCTPGTTINTDSVLIIINPTVTPTFTAIAAVCSGAAISALPTTSNNGITGTWSPALNNTATTTYTFTPSGGQCATTTTLTITVNPANITPTFTAVPAICSGAALSALPTTSNNGITGSWSPALNNTATTIYTFTPDAGQCATTATLTITVNSNVTPTFTSVTPICSGATLSALPTTSNNGITGTWSPALNNTATTTYTFTPTAGQCATTATLSITVNSNITPTFTAVAPICSGAALAALPTTSNNGITGTWSPALDNTATTTYTFTPTAGQCATTTTLTITVNPNVTPTFNAVAAICTGSVLAALPTTSNEGITGTWAPALNNTATTTYTFTPTAGQCATTTTITITVNPANTVPTFTAVAPICSGATTLSALPTTSNNGITGIWSPALNNTATTTYTFTPTAGQCAVSTTLTITVNPNITPTFNPVAAICSGGKLNALPVTSNEGITGTWSPALDNTTTTTYTFTPTAGQCAVSTTLTITVNPNITPTFNVVAPICFGGTLNALPTTSNEGITGTWSPALDNTSTTTYTFTPTIGQCAVLTTFAITVNVLPKADFVIGQSSLCTQRVINFSDASSSNIKTWSWDFGDGNTSALQNPAHTYSSDASYDVKLQVTDNNGCSSNPGADSEITVNPLPQAGFALPVICLSGGTAAVNFTPNNPGTANVITWQWNFDNGIPQILQSAQPVTYTFTTGGAHTIQLIEISNVGCTDTLTQNDTAYSTPTAKDSILNDTALCSINPVVLLNESSVSVGNITRVDIYWDNLNNPNSVFTDNSPVANGTYTNQYPAVAVNKSYEIIMKVYSGNQCPTASDTSAIIVHGTPAVQFAPLSAVCQEVQPFALTGGSQVSNNLTGTGSYSGPSGIINDSAFSPQLAGPGTFPIIYTFTSNGCFDTAMQSITVYPTPLVDYGGVQSVLEGDSITLNPVSVSGIGLQYLWVPSIYLNTDTSATPLSKPSDDVTYTITVTSPGGGCRASATLLVQVLKDFQVPNTFTPNNDGINDTWVIENLPKYPIQWVQVFDRYGQLLYESHGYSTPWDGTYKGKQLPSGTYYYIIELNGLRSPKTGYVTILR